jgi:hypothetical protein
MNQVSIDNFDAVAESDRGYKLALKNTDGTSCGVTLCIVGRHSDIVVRWLSVLVNGYQREQALAARKGKTVEPKSMDEIKAQNIEGAVIRVTGWENVTQEFSVALMRKALTRNPHWVDQILEASDDLGNFTAQPSAT